MIGNGIGRYIKIDKAVENLSNNYLYLKVVVDTEKPLMVGFWWQNSQGDETWTNIKYERLSDFCYRYERLGHTTQSCKEDVKISEIKEGHPMYGPWLIGTRPNKILFSRMSEGIEKRMPRPDRNPRRTWYDIMNAVKEKESDELNQNMNKGISRYLAMGKDRGCNAR